MNIFRLFGSVVLQGGDETEKQLDSIDKKGESTGGTLANMGKKVAAAGTAIVGGMAAAGTAVIALATKTSQTTDRIDKMSQKLGMSRQGFQEWDFILSQSGASIDSMSAGIKSMTTLLEDASKGGDKSAEVFDRLGMSLDDVASMGREEAFEAMVTALQNVEDEAERATLANLAFGKAGSELMPLLNAGAESVDSLKNKAHELGLVMGDEAIDAGVQFTDTMDQLKRTAGAVLTQALAPLLPILNGLMQELIKIVPPLMGFIQPLVEKLIPVVERIITALLPVFIRLLDAFMPILDPLIDIFIMLLDTGLIPLIEFGAQIIEAILPGLITLLEALVPALKPFMDLLEILLNLLMPVFVKIFSYVSDFIIPNVVETIKGLVPVFEAVMKAIGHLMDFWLAVFSGDWTKAWDSLKSYFMEIWNAISGAFKAVINNIIRGLNFLIGGLNKISFSLPDWIPGIGGKSFGINISEIPMLADGGIIRRSGAVIVGEEGPEMLELSAGAKVSPLPGGDKSGGVNININNPHIFNDRDADKLGDLIVNRLRTLGVVT